MKTLGLIGGLSWYSTVVYYRTINKLINEKLGGAHSARLLLYSVDFNEFKILQEKNDWPEIESMLVTIAGNLERGGAECIVMCTNTPHLVADNIRKKISIPLLHIAEETAMEIRRQNIGKVGLVGTKFTMENSFFKDKLSKSGITTIVPDAHDRNLIHNSVFEELTKGIFKPETRSRYVDIFAKLKANGAEGIIFGCTEISLLIESKEVNLPVFDTAVIHAKAAVDFALAN